MTDINSTIFDVLGHLRDLPQNTGNQPVTNFLKACAQNVTRSRSQLFQDVFVLFCLNGKKDGFFVEFGATDGVTLSNTFLLEKEFGWTGILAEPAKNWRSGIAKNRTSKIDYRCVWEKTGEELEFLETPYGELSTIAMFKDKDGNRGGRQKGEKYNVDTISLNDLLKFHNAPQEIDYVSIDTEGSELTILNAFDFSKHKIKVMTVEHNYTLDREKINKLLDAQGFQHVFPMFSKYDDWYIHRSAM